MKGLNVNVLWNNSLSPTGVGIFHCLGWSENNTEWLLSRMAKNAPRGRHRKKSLFVEETGMKKKQNSGTASITSDSPPLDVYWPLLSVVPSTPMYRSHTPSSMAPSSPWVKSPDTRHIPPPLDPNTTLAHHCAPSIPPSSCSSDTPKVVHPIT